MTECNAQTELFSIGRRTVTATVSEALLTSDAGVLALSQLDRRMDLTRSLSKALVDRRESRKVRHSMQDLLRQRIYQICCGYEDVSDANTLRSDPALQTALCRVAGRPESELASQPTLSRLETRVRRADIHRFSEWLLDRYVRQLRKLGPSAFRRIVLDFDSTDDPVHGAQQLAMFHGYYDQWMYHPILVFDSRGYPVAALLRPGNAHDSWGAVALLRRIVERLRRAFPKAEILLRADAGFAVPELYEFCENAQIPYVIGQITNPRVVRRAETWLAKARSLYEKTGEKATLFGSFRHRADSWQTSRRIIAKAEVMAMGDNPRFLVTTLTEDAEAVYRFYTERGQTENFIKDLKNALFADRLSCHLFLANQFRLLLHVVAYVLLFELRQQMAGTVAESWQMDTLRLRLLKIAASVKVTARRVWFQLASCHPEVRLSMWLMGRLGAPAALA